VSPDRGGRVLEAENSGLLGVGPELDLHEALIELAPRDRLLFATDGLYEQRDPARNALGYEPCLGALGAGATIPECVAAMRAVFDAHRGQARRDDDVTGVFVGIQPSEGSR
jgi:serine phosphatase RsbU (regulator of sigma subunit)